MKRVGIGLACIIMVCCNAKAQFLGGIFSQGKTELKNSTTQLALLEALSGSTDAGYTIFEDGLTNTAIIHGAEYGLHQTYFASLVAVNPAVANLQETADIINDAAAISDVFPAAIQRWRSSGQLTTVELGYVSLASANTIQSATTLLDQLQELLTAGTASLSDADRIQRLRQHAEIAKEQYQFMLEFIAGGDLLIAARQKQTQ